MLKTKGILRGYSTAESRWARFGPYYAMFPLDFAFEVVQKYSEEGDFIIDPFAGRGSSIYAGSVLGRYSLGIEINPVGWLYGRVKLRPADKAEVTDRLLDIYSRRNYFKRKIEEMPLFYRMCYCDEVLKFLLAARKNLNWKVEDADATLMSIILVYLHGKLGEGLSNQMRMSKAMGINYSMKWWKKNGFIKPPEINPCEFIMKKVEWRFALGKPCTTDSRIIFGDSSIELGKLASAAPEKRIKCKLLFTSPPYFSVTDYYADQWLRLWLLGGSEFPKLNREKHKNRFVSEKEYIDLLEVVFKNCALLMDKKSTIYVRTDKRKFTFGLTKNILIKYFPSHRMRIYEKLYAKRTQTEMHGNKSSEIGEIDIVMKN